MRERERESIWTRSWTGHMSLGLGTELRLRFWLTGWLAGLDVLSLNNQ